MSNLTLYRFTLSGHSHRAELFTSLLKLDVNMVDVALQNGAQKHADFLKMNIFGQVPVLKHNDDIINDSNAILLYLAQKFDANRTWYPEDVTVQAHIQRWLSVAAGLVASGPCAARLVTVFGAELDHQNAINIAHTLFKTMDAYLQNREYLVGTQPTIADIANFSYIAHAPEGGVSLEQYPNILRWLNNVRKLDGFIAMPETKAGLLA
ncbi:glutathione S-transferase [Pseudoalteromonas fuliginea]|uniref:Glutathione S-transferase n=1 Tax=Pseudoalteromonas fuliginea TaxID=1872678 RepID=A0ABD3Y775_9GAMM|nr:glutathione S-transferase [Pseudoalteromonas fuliginea]KDC50121.1 glutathione S-transferase [Pseudoalteromonas fuliginea]KJZ27225.1 glutathione S-transferase [Pseudoalteromonas fuliginea]